MKTFLTTAIVSLISVISFAQAPQALNYQAIARTAQGQIIPAQNVNVRFSILDGSITGTTIYQETHSTTTNNFGLFTLAIGRGTVTSGTFSAINWGTGDKFLKVEIAADGSGNYQLQGTTQLLSVPYSLYSESTRLVAGNAINITNGNTISANYLPGIGINIAGNTISGNYAGGTGVTITGNTISGNYAAGTGVTITGNTISGNYAAGTGVTITGNVISALGNNLWIPDANGMHSSVPRVGIGVNAHPIYPLYVRQPNSGGYGIAVFESDDVWHAAIAIKNNPADRQYSFIVGGPTNTELLPNNFAIYNNTLMRSSILVDGATNYIGIGAPTLFTPPIRSALHIFTGDVNIEQIGRGIIIKSPNGSCWRITIDDAGNLVRTAIACP
jgi:hypothetical protein